MNALKRPFVLLALTVIVVLLGGLGIFLAAWEIPAPSARIEKVIPNDRFSR